MATQPQPLEIKTEMVHPKIEDDSYFGDNSTVHGFENADQFSGSPFHHPMHDNKKLRPNNVVLDKFVVEEVDTASNLACCIEKNIPEMNHFEEFALTCTQCGRSYRSKKGLTEHMNYCGKTNDEIEKFKCSLCYFETNWKKSLGVHILRKHPVDTISMKDYLVCPTCQKYYKGKNNLTDHMKYCGKTNLMKLKCILCPFVTNRKQCLNRHLKAKHPEQEIARPVCIECGKSYADKNCLSTHMKYCGKADRKLQCYFCPFETKWKRSLKGHILHKHPIDAIDYLACPVCRKYYKGKYNLRVHMKYCGKTDGKLKCDSCRFETKWEKSLKRHIAQKHPIGVIYYFISPGCGKSFVGKNRLRKHLKHCGKANDEIVAFQCFLCSYKAKWKNCMRRHIRRKHPIHETENILH